jgi:energy-coupling factor transporter ATP-binding protein EcfA2
LKEVEQLLEQPNLQSPLGIRDRAMLEVLYATGMRVSELTQLPINQVNLEGGTCSLFGKGSKRGFPPFLCLSRMRGGDGDPLSLPHFHHGKLTGKVLVDGLDTGKHPVHELFRHAGLVFQNPDAQLFNQTVEAEMVYGLESLGLEPSEIEKKTGLGEQSDRTRFPHGPLTSYTLRR